MTTSKRLNGKVAIVTGGASGIGAATVRRVVEEGGLVTIADLDGDQADILAKELGDAALAVQFDAGDVASVERLVATTVEHYGRLDLLHNNAAIMSAAVIAQDTNPVDIDFEIWDRTMAVNLRGYLAGVKYHDPPHAGTRGWIHRPHRVRVRKDGRPLEHRLRHVEGGCHRSEPLHRHHLRQAKHPQQCHQPGPDPDGGRQENVQGPMVEIMERNTLVPRLGQPEDIAAAVAYLFSDDAAYVTGVELDVDGGMLCHAPYMSDVLQSYGTGQAFGDPDA